MIIDELIERADAVGGPVPDIFQVDYEQEGDDVCVYLWFADDFNNGNPIIAIDAQRLSWLTATCSSVPCICGLVAEKH